MCHKNVLYEFHSIFCMGAVGARGPGPEALSQIYYITNWYSILCGNIQSLFSICLGISVIEYVY